MSYYKYKCNKYKNKLKKLEQQYGGYNKEQLIKDINNPNVIDSAIIRYFEKNKINIHESIKPDDKILDCFPEYKKKIKYDWIDVVADSNVYRLNVLWYLLENGSGKIISKKPIISGDLNAQEYLVMYFRKLKNDVRYKCRILRLLNLGIDSNVKNNDGTPLLNFVAEQYNNIYIDMVTELIKHGADVNGTDKYGRTPLNIAVNELHPYIDMVTELIKHGADVNVKDYYGKTPLHSAAKTNDDIDIIQKLIKNGADINARDNEGKLPLDYAFNYNRQKTIEYIEKYIEESMKRQQIQDIASTKISKTYKRFKHPIDIGKIEILQLHGKERFSDWEKICATLKKDYRVDDLRSMVSSIGLPEFNYIKETLDGMEVKYDISEKRYLCHIIAKYLYYVTKTDNVYDEDKRKSYISNKMSEYVTDLIESYIIKST